MIDESKHRHWKGQLASCPRCGHRMSISDYNVWHNMCPFCGKIVKPMLDKIEEVEIGYREVNPDGCGDGDKNAETKRSNESQTA